MFVILLTYKVPLATVDKYLDLHVEYLKEQYEYCNFVASGRKVPRTGGVILSQLDDRNALDKIIAQDPFKLNDIAVYDIIEFIPSMTSKSLSFLITNDK